MITSYEKLLESLVQTQVNFALVGGLAVCLNGFVRTTDDVDILIDNSADNVTRLSRVLAAFGEGLGKDLTTSDLTNEPGAVRIQEDFILDIFVQMNGKTLGDYSPWIGYHALKSGVQIPFLKIAGLIETKRGSLRQKDQVDIGALTDISRAKNEADSLHDFTLDSVRTLPDPE
ncbi:MAG: hypothetical protein LV480_02060 [Methylacidiphilales bacterium]|nr:hypothetical protein [Candidatus Methylacidiphilales bacterium]